MADSTLATVLPAAVATVLASVLTGGALLLQSALNRRQERQRQKEERAEARRKEEANARAEWAAAFQEAFSGSIGGIGWWKLLVQRPNGDVPERAFQHSTEARAAHNRGRMATARLMVVDRDKVVRAVANTLMLSLELALPPAVPKAAEIDGIVAHETQRLNALYLGFLEFMEVLAGIPGADVRDNILRRTTEGGHLPPDVKARILAAIDSKATVAADAPVP